MKKQDAAALADFLFEVGMLAKTPRSGFHFLGTGKQSVAEHINRTVYIGYVLAMMDGHVDVATVMKMCLFHDLGEARASDLGYIHQKYATADEDRAIRDAATSLPFGKDIIEIWEKYEQRTSQEALLTKDADQLDLLLSLKEQIGIGNQRAATWLPPVMKRFKTKVGKELAKKILTTDYDHWWYADKDDEWWVSRNGKK